MFLPSHPIHTHLHSVSHLYEEMDRQEKPYTASAVQLAGRLYFTTAPNGLHSDASDIEKKRHVMQRVRGLKEYNYQVFTDVLMILDESSGSGAIIYPGQGKVVKVKKGAGRLACSYRAECVATEAEFMKLKTIIKINESRKMKV
uniref:Uncharacterized protein n=1 Tax=Trypanosoma brucei brucei (strain 927/4 GUTat10.1) TaxID=185431 RepID=Q4FKP0_TRYB2|nr:hypothetical protein Tb10.v4.0050 [Trypanosoma brucei brucei TREU927]